MAAQTDDETVITSDILTTDREISFTKKYNYKKPLKIGAKYTANSLFKFFCIYSNISTAIPDSLETECVLSTFCEIQNIPDMSIAENPDEMEKMLDVLFEELLRAFTFACNECLLHCRDNNIQDPEDFISLLTKINTESVFSCLTEPFGLMCRLRIEDPNVCKFVSNEDNLPYQSRKPLLGGKPAVERATLQYILKNVLLVLIIAQYSHLGLKQDDLKIIVDQFFTMRT